MRSYLFILLFVFLSVAVSARRHHRHEPKHVWPETMHKSVHYAESLIKKECANCRIEILKPSDPMTRDLDRDRVRLVVDDNYRVINIPRRG